MSLAQSCSKQAPATAYSAKRASDSSIPEYNQTGLVNAPMSVNQQQLVENSKTYGGKQ